MAIVELAERWNGRRQEQRELDVQHRLFVIVRSLCDSTTTCAESRARAPV